VRPTDPRFAWNQVRVDTFYVDAAHTAPFTGRVLPGLSQAVSEDGQQYRVLYGDAVETGAPLTMLAFNRGLRRLGGDWGQYIVIIGVLLFAISTAISWSYYGDRSAQYLFGSGVILPYRLIFVLMHFVGAVLPLASVWALGDVFLGMVILPNLLALILLSGKVRRMTDSYFERRPWVENALAHKQRKERER